MTVQGCSSGQFTVPLVVTEDADGLTIPPPPTASPALPGSAAAGTKLLPRRGRHSPTGSEGLRPRRRRGTPVVTPSGVAPRVLIVEDDPSVRGLLGAVLEEAGYRVLPTDHALDPVDVAQLRPDLVLLDLILHGTGAGWRLLHGLRALAGTAGLPIVVCTADHALAHREADRLRALGVGLVLKPFDLDDVLRRVLACRPATADTGDGSALDPGSCLNTVPAPCRHPAPAPPRTGREGDAMRYDVTYLLSSQKCTDRVEARDAALAVDAVEAAHGQMPDRFELLAVSLLDGLSSPGAAVAGPRGVETDGAAGACAG